MSAGGSGGLPAVPRDCARLLRHRTPALLLGEIAALDRTTLVCTSRGSGPWRWAQLLEGAAQAAGLLAGLQPDGASPGAVIAELRDVVLDATAHSGPVRFRATLERRVLGFWRCGVEVHDADGRRLCAARIAVAGGTGAAP